MTIEAFVSVIEQTSHAIVRGGNVLGSLVDGDNFSGQFAAILGLGLTFAIVGGVIGAIHGIPRLVDKIAERKRPIKNSKK